MEPSFGWVSLTPKALARARAQLNDQGQGVRDEVGFLLLHQRYADRFFPGTSVLHTRLRYVMFVPWHFEDQAGKSAAQAANALISAETALAKRLKDSGERGVIGGLTWPEPADQPPASVYWSALDAWGILRRDGRDRTPTRRGVHLQLSVGRPSTDDDGEPLVGYHPPFVTMPGPPSDWPTGRPVTFVLREDEQAFLRERLGAVAAPAPHNHLSLFSQLVRHNVRPPVSMWSSQVRRRAGRDVAPLDRARAAASLAAIGRGVYAALVEELRDRQDGRETPQHHRTWLPDLVREHAEAALELAPHGLVLIEEDVGGLPQDMRNVIQATLSWLAAGAGDPQTLLPTYAAAESRKLDRARLSSTPTGRARRAEWQAHDHPIGYPLHYRWTTVRNLLTDLQAPTA